jgi:pentatricopeptide repeat protein
MLSRFQCQPLIRSSPRRLDLDLRLAASKTTCCAHLHNYKKCAAFQSQNRNYYSKRPSRILAVVVVSDRLPLAATTNCRWYSSSLDPEASIPYHEKPIYRAARNGNPEQAESLFLERGNSASLNRDMDNTTDGDGGAATTNTTTTTRKLFKPQLRAGLAVLHAYTKADHPAKAQAFLNQLWQLYESDQMKVYPPTKAYNTVMNGWSNTSKFTKDVPHQTHFLLKEMKGKYQQGFQDLRPDVVSYSVVMKAYGKVGQAVQAEKLLDEMYQDYQSGNLSAQPDLRAFGILAMAWARSKSSEAPERAASILNRLWELYESKVVPFKPNRILYNTVLDCWAKSHSRNAPEKAQALLQEMQHRFETTGDYDLRPDVVSYSVVIHAYARQGNIAKAESMLEKLHQEYRQGNETARPNVRSFSMVLAAYAKAKGSSPLQAERVLEHMKELHQSGTLEDKPNYFSYSNVIQCWANATNVNPQKAIERTKALLLEMETQYKAGDLEMQPRARTYNSVMLALAKVGRVQEAEQLLQNQYREYLQGNEQCKPDAHNFSTVLSAWSNHRSPTAPQRAQDVLKRMWDLYEKGQLDSKPAVVSYGCVIHCWVQSTKPNAPEMAEALLRELQSISQQPEHKDLKPNAVIYNSVLNAYAKRGQAKKAEALLQEMYDDYYHGNESARPNLRAFAVVLNAWSKSRFPDAPQRAEDILKKMRQLHASGELETQPNTVSYNSVIHSWANMGGAVAGERAEELLRDMQARHAAGEKDVQPDIITYSSVFAAWIKSGQEEAASKSEALLKEMLEQSQKGIKGVTPDLGCYNLVLRSIEHGSDKTERATRIFQLMQANNIVPNKLTNRVLSSCGVQLHDLTPEK